MTISGGALPGRPVPATTILAWFARRLRDLLDLAAPWRCPLCGQRLARGPRCRGCRLPRRTGGIRQLRQDRDGPYLLLAGGRFRGRLRRLVHACKYRGDPAAARIAAWQAELALPRDLRWEAIVPVPAHPLRRRERGFDPVLELARAIGRRRGIPVRRWLRRTRYTPLLAGRGRMERSALLRGALAARAASGSLLVVDDVATSGASFRACRRALLDAGASGVDLLVVALTPRPGILAGRPTPGPRPRPLSARGRCASLRHLATAPGRCGPRAEVRTCSAKS